MTDLVGDKLFRVSPGNNNLGRNLTVIRSERTIHLIVSSSDEDFEATLNHMVARELGLWLITYTSAWPDAVIR